MQPFSFFLHHIKITILYFNIQRPAKFKIMKGLKSFFLVIGFSLIVFTTNAQLCEITADRYKGCQGDQFRFEIDAQTYTYYSIKWEFGDGVISNQLTSFIQHRYDTFGVFTVKVTLFSDASGTIKCGPNSVIIKVNDPPNAIIGLLSPDKQLLKGNYFEFIDNSLPGKSNAPIILKIWDFGDGGYDSVPNPVYSYHKSDIYRVYIQICDSNGCCDTVSKVVTVMDSSTSIVESVKSTEFLIYPNPFTESVNVLIPKDKTITEVDLLDLSGKSLHLRRNIKGNNLEIFREDIPQGIYLLKIVSDKVYFFKLLAK